MLVNALLFPITMCFTLLAAWRLFVMDVDPGLIVGLASTVTIVVLFIAEKKLAFRQDWRGSQGDVGTDILHNLINSYGFRELCKLIFIALMVPVVAALAESQQRLWPRQWPLIAQVFWAALWAEFGYYWVHRLCHENEFFWRFHAVHHSPERLYWLNAGRDHPLGVLLFYLAGATPLILMGAPLEALTLFFVLEAVHGLFQHANVNVKLGPLNWVFSMAELHRWHHSRQVKEANHNYGLTLILWDVIFRTRFLPDLQGPKKIGVGGFKAFPQTFWRQMLVPFQWKKLKDK